MTIGEQIIAAIAKGGLFSANDVDGPVERPLIYVWSSGAAEQLEAVVEAHIEERVRVELEKYRKGFLEKL